MSDVLEPGARIGAYEVLERLGRGGMGEVYKARDTRLGRLVAIKVLAAGADPELLRRLQREARAASALNHPHIVHIYDVGEADARAGAYHVVMELVEGETLRRRLAPGPLPLAELLDLLAQLGDGLAKAHGAGIVHRDLKPENLMVTPDGRLKILDFGLAKVLAAPLQGVDARDTLTRHETQAGALLGTIEYMSPEQASGRAVDHRTDQFSLGVIAYEMAAGRSPFRRATPAQVLAAVIEREPEPLARLRADVPGELEILVARCLQKDPSRRFARTEDLAAQLATLAGRARSGSLAGAAASSPRSVEVVPQPVPTPGTSIYHVQSGQRVRRYDEAELARLIRHGKLTGAELARRDDEERWQPLFESRVYRREVPTTGDPRDAARLRALRMLGGSFSGFFITGVVMYSIQGQLPFWLAIWGAVLAVQTLGSMPTLWTLVQRRRLEGTADAGAAAAGQRQLPHAADAAPSALAQEAARVRALIEQRGGSDAPRLLADVDRILALAAELGARQVDLEEQTPPAERAGLARALAEARTRLERADLAQDRRLFERQAEVLQAREEGIAKALRVLERLRVRREVVEHQLKQLRLDLSRGAASGFDVPELSSRLEFIRDEVDAREEVDEIAAAGRG